MTRESAEFAPSQRMSAKAKASSERVLDAAAKLFRQRGYAATTIRDVAEEADMQAGSLYYHYASKQELLEAVLERTMNELAATVGPVLSAREEGLSYRETFRRALNAHLSVTTRLGDYSVAARRLLNEVNEEVRNRHLSVRRVLDHHWRQLFVSAKLAGEIRGDLDIALVRMLVIGALNSAHEWYRPDGKSIEELADTLTALVFEGLWPRDEMRLLKRS